MKSILNKEPVLRAEKSLKQFNPDLKVIVLEQTARTANDAATALGCKVGAIVKSLLFKAGDSYVLCLVSGDKRCSLNKLKNSLDINFNKAVEKILNCKKGKVILSGVGKSGIIAKKIASTLASVGTPSFFVDASSCSHGDLGQISSNDILILISNSGESIELKNIIQFANRNKNITLIGIVSKKNYSSIQSI